MAAGGPSLEQLRALSQYMASSLRVFIQWPDDVVYGYGGVRDISGDIFTDIKFELMTVHKGANGQVNTININATQADLSTVEETARNQVLYELACIAHHLKPNGTEPNPYDPTVNAGLINNLKAGVTASAGIARATNPLAAQPTTSSNVDDHKGVAPGIRLRLQRLQSAKSKGEKVSQGVQDARQVIAEGNEELSARERYLQHIQAKKNQAVNVVKGAIQQAGTVALTFSDAVLKQLEAFQADINNLQLPAGEKALTHIESQTVANATSAISDLITKLKGYNISFDAEHLDVAKAKAKMGSLIGQLGSVLSEEEQQTALTGFSFACAAKLEKEINIVATKLQHLPADRKTQNLQALEATLKKIENQFSQVRKIADPATSTASSGAGAGTQKISPLVAAVAQKLTDIQTAIKSAAGSVARPPQPPIAPPKGKGGQPVKPPAVPPPEVSPGGSHHLGNPLTRQPVGGVDEKKPGHTRTDSGGFAVANPAAGAGAADGVRRNLDVAFAAAATDVDGQKASSLWLYYDDYQRLLKHFLDSSSPWQGGGGTVSRTAGHRSFNSNGLSEALLNEMKRYLGNVLNTLQPGQGPGIAPDGHDGSTGIEMTVMATAAPTSPEKLSAYNAGAAGKQRRRFSQSPEKPSSHRTATGMPKQTDTKQAVRRPTLPLELQSFQGYYREGNDAPITYLAATSGGDSTNGTVGHYLIRSVPALDFEPKSELKARYNDLVLFAESMATAMKTRRSQELSWDKYFCCGCLGVRSCSCSRPDFSKDSTVEELHSAVLHFLKEAQDAQTALTKDSCKYNTPRFGGVATGVVAVMAAASMGSGVPIPDFEIQPSGNGDTCPSEGGCQPGGADPTPTIAPTVAPSSTPAETSQPPSNSPVAASASGSAAASTQAPVVSNSATVSASGSNSAVPATPSSSSTPSASFTPIVTVTPTGTTISTPTGTITITPVPTSSTSTSATAAMTSSANATVSAAGTSSPTSSVTAIVTFTPSGSTTPTAIATVSNTPTTSMSVTATVTSSGSATVTSYPSPTSSSTAQVTTSPTSSGTGTATVTVTQTPTATVTVTQSPDGTVSVTATPTSSNTASSTAQATASPSVSPTGAAIIAAAPTFNASSCWNFFNGGDPGNTCDISQEVRVGTGVTNATLSYKGSDFTPVAGTNCTNTNPGNPSAGINTCVLTIQPDGSVTGGDATAFNFCVVGDCTISGTEITACRDSECTTQPYDIYTGSGRRMQEQGSIGKKSEFNSESIQKPPVQAAPRSLPAPVSFSEMPLWLSALQTASTAVIELGGAATSGAVIGAIAAASDAVKEGLGYSATATYLTVAAKVVLLAGVAWLAAPTASATAVISSVTWMAAMQEVATAAMDAKQMNDAHRRRLGAAVATALAAAITANPMGIFTAAASLIPGGIGPVLATLYSHGHWTAAKTLISVLASNVAGSVVQKYRGAIVDGAAQMRKTVQISAISQMAEEIGMSITPLLSLLFGNNVKGIPSPLATEVAHSSLQATACYYAITDGATAPAIIGGKVAGMV